MGPGLAAAGELRHTPAAATACTAVLLATSCVLPSTTPARQATGIARLDSLLQNVLLGGSGRWPGLLFRCAGACITCLHCFAHADCEWLLKCVAAEASSCCSVRVARCRALPNQTRASHAAPWVCITLQRWPRLSLQPRHHWPPDRFLPQPLLLNRSHHPGTAGKSPFAHSYDFVRSSGLSACLLRLAGANTQGLQARAAFPSHYHHCFVMVGRSDPVPAATAVQQAAARLTLMQLLRLQCWRGCGRAPACWPSVHSAALHASPALLSALPPQVAALEHFRSAPASFLAAAALEGQDAIEAALEDLDSATLAEVGWALLECAAS